MTEEYKEALLKYLTGNLQPQEPIEGVIAQPELTEEITNNLETYLSNKFGSTYTIEGMLESPDYETSIIYGSRRMNGTNYGFLLIVDNANNPIKLLETYDSGTLLGRFYKIAIDEKNQIYGIDYNPDTTKYRFIMINNIFQSEEAILRQSWNLPNEVDAMNKTNLVITKDPLSANYLIGGIVFQGNVYQPKVAQLTVNVGSENEWKYYSYADTLLATEGNLSNIYATWEDGVPDFKISAFTSYQIVIYGKYKDDLIDATLYDVGDTWQSTTIYSATSIIADIDTCYYGVHATADGQELLALYQIKNGVQTFITGVPLKNSTTDTAIKYNLIIKNGTLFFSEVFPITDSTYYVIGGIYKEGVINETISLAYDIEVYGFVFNLFNIVNNFNLYSFNFQVGEILYKTKISYNPNINFVSLETGKNNPTDFKPLSMSLFEDEKLIFNRSLYNLIISGSTTTSTVEVPNTMLNTNTIDGENLLGNQALQITNNTEEITTNEYETLLINTFNSLSMINLDTNVLYPQGSARLNSSANQVQDYNNAKCSKIRINYSDNTTKVLSITFYHASALYCYTKFAIYVDKEISSIDFISEDENTIYNKITPTLTVGNIYTISQGVTIDEVIDGTMWNGVSFIEWDVASEDWR